MKFLLDTNVLREIGKTRPNQNVAIWLASVEDSDLAVSVITVREVRKGIARLRFTKPETAGAIDRRMSDILAAFGERVLPVSQDVADLWGELLGASEKHIDDTGLAATARVHELVLATRNIQHIVGRGAHVLDPFKTKPKVTLL